MQSLGHPEGLPMDLSPKVNSHLAAPLLLLTLSMGLAQAKPLDDKYGEHPLSQEPRKKAESLSNDEEAVLRGLIYGKGLSIGHKEVNGFPQRVIPRPNKLLELYEKKRLAVLQVLLDIVKGGRPEDALTAAGYAIALEESPSTAVFCAETKPVRVDEAPFSKTGE